MFEEPKRKDQIVRRLSDMGWKIISISMSGNSRESFIKYHMTLEQALSFLGENEISLPDIQKVFDIIQGMNNGTLNEFIRLIKNGMSFDISMYKSECHEMIEQLKNTKNHVAFPIFPIPISKLVSEELWDFHKKIHKHRIEKLKLVKRFLEKILKSLNGIDQKKTFIRSNYQGEYINSEGEYVNEFSKGCEK